MNPSQTLLVEYRLDISPTEEVISIDEADMVTGLQGLGVKPIRVRTNGNKLVYEFLKAEALGPFQKIQKGLAGALNEPLLVDYIEELKARHAWKGNLTMMRNVRVLPSTS